MSLKSEPPCIHLKWLHSHALGKKFGFCDAGKNTTPADYTVPVPPHGELCPQLAGEECRWYKPYCYKEKKPRVAYPSPDLNRNEL
jgi:hypothetical protein